MERFQDFDTVICIDEFDKDFNYSNDFSFPYNVLFSCEKLEHPMVKKRILKTLTRIGSIRMIFKRCPND